MTGEKEVEVLFDPFPKQQEFIDATFSGDYDFILFGGAVKGGKTFCLLGIFILLSRFFPGSRWVIVRADLPTIKRNLYPVWDKIKPTNYIIDNPPRSDPNTITFINKSQIIFFPEGHEKDKEMLRWRGLDANGFGFDEINECQMASFFKAFERSGSHLIKGAVKQPKPIVIATCNPTTGWVKTLIHDPYEKGTLKKNWLYIPSRIYDNIPLLAQQPGYLTSLKANLNHYEYEVFVEGNWNVQLKTGGEWLRNFEVEKHVKPVRFDPAHTVHIAMDNNVYPYVATEAWQFIPVTDGGWIIRQINEMPCEDPYNSPAAAGNVVAAWLHEIGYNAKVFLYGDRSTKARNNIDERKRSIFQIFQEMIQQSGFRTEDKFLSFAPVVSNIGDFINAIFAGEILGLSIEIGEHCKKSINDYIITKTNNDGGLLKTRVTHPNIKDLTYEENGHLTDNMKDIIVQAFYPQFIRYLQSKSAIVPGGISRVHRGTKFTL